MSAIKLRNRMARKRKKFLRQQSKRFKKLGTEWRRPRGKHSKMRIEITPYHEGPRVLVFDVSGLEETVAAMPCLSAHGK